MFKVVVGIRLADFRDLRSRGIQRQRAERALQHSAVQREHQPQTDAKRGPAVLPCLVEIGTIDWRIGALNVDPVVNAAKNRVGGTPRNNGRRTVRSAGSSCGYNSASLPANIDGLESPSMTSHTRTDDVCIISSYCTGKA
jgi:hypothetical protein